MARRILSLWLPRLPTDRLRRRARARADASPPGQDGEGQGDLDRPPAAPLAVVAGERGRTVLVALDAVAESAGLVPGMTLTDARAVEPGLRMAESDPVADARALGGLADWCGRYTPWVGLDSPDGLLLDLTGCAHLFGGEGRLSADLAGRLAGFGYSCRLAVADTPGAAWALTRFDPDPIATAPPGGTRAALAPLPVAALRLPDEAVAMLVRLGLRRVGDLLAVPRASLATRVGSLVVRRLDQSLGIAAEPVTPRRPVPPHAVRLALAEPIREPAQIAAVLDRLLARLCAGLERAGQGARRIELACFRTDGVVARAEAGTSRPARDPCHLARLFDRKLERIDPGLGIEVMALLAAAEPMAPIQPELVQPGLVRDWADEAPPVLADLVDRLGSRLGLASIARLLPRQSWWPERMTEPAPVFTPPVSAPLPQPPWPGDRPRPVRLLPRAEPIEVVAPVPDDPPLMFRWRDRLHRVRHADGPERIEPEWWREHAEPRDYYRVEDEQGRRYWVYRAGLHQPGHPARWFLHGVFA